MTKEKLYGNPPDFVDQAVNFVVETFQGKGPIAKIYLVSDVKTGQRKMYEIVGRGKMLSLTDHMLLGGLQAVISRVSKGTISTMTIPEEEIGPFKTSWKRNKSQVVEIDLNIGKLQDEVDALFKFFAPEAK